MPPCTVFIILCKQLEQALRATTNTYALTLYKITETQYQPTFHNIQTISRNMNMNIFIDLFAIRCGLCKFKGMVNTPLHSKQFHRITHRPTAFTFSHSLTLSHTFYSNSHFFPPPETRYHIAFHKFKANIPRFTFAVSRFSILRTRNVLQYLQLPPYLW